jgi:predicted DNA-binding protein
MPVFKKRNRIVSFRVSEDEYQTLQRVSEQQGAHSVSDYARYLACRGFDRHKDHSLAAQLDHLSSRVDDLAHNVARLAALVLR